MLPKLVVFAGPPCSGKSTLAVRVEARWGVPHLQMDDTRERILPGAAHTRADRMVAYRAMAFAAELLVSHGVAAALDATYAHPEDRRDLEEVARRTGTGIFLIECEITPAFALERFRRRSAGPRLDLTAERVVGMVRNYPFCGKGLRLDSGELGVEEGLALVEEYLATGRPLAPGAWLKSS